MKLSDLNTALERHLKDYVKQQGYVDSGKLLKSIKFKSTNTNYVLDVKLVAEDYIEYLDEGNFLNKFFAQDKVLNLITEYQAQLIDEKIQKELDEL